MPGSSSHSFLSRVRDVFPLNHVPFYPLDGGVGGLTSESIPWSPWGVSSWRASIAPSWHIAQEEVVNHSSALNGHFFPSWSCEEASETLGASELGLGSAKTLMIWNKVVLGCEGDGGGSEICSSQPFPSPFPREGSQAWPMLPMG